MLQFQIPTDSPPLYACGLVNRNNWRVLFMPIPVESQHHLRIIVNDFRRYIEMPPLDEAFFEFALSLDKLTILGDQNSESKHMIAFARMDVIEEMIDFFSYDLESEINPLV